METADKSSHRRSRDGNDLDAAFLQHLNDADVRIAARTPAAERERRAYWLVHGTSVEVTHLGHAFADMSERRRAPVTYLAAVGWLIVSMRG